MPELPEVERARQAIERRALHRRIAAVDDRDTYVSRPHAPGEIESALRGRELVAAHRRGKSLWMETDDEGPCSACISAWPAASPSTRSPRPGAGTASRSSSRTAAASSLRDRRRLGRPCSSPRIDRLGPDAEDITRNAVPRARRLRPHADQGAPDGPDRARGDRQPAGRRDPLAGAHRPRRPAGGLSEEELDRLRRAMRSTLRKTIRRGGAHTGDFMQARERHGICPRCGAEVQRTTVGGRTTVWCPREQVLVQVSVSSVWNPACGSAALARTQAKQVAALPASRGHRQRR